MNNLSNAKHPLDGCFAKLERIHHGLKELDAHIAAYSMSSHQIGVRHEPEKQIATFYIRRFLEPPPSLSVLVGEILHNARSCLDQLLWQMIQLNGNQPSGRSEFPIFRDKLQFPGIGNARVRGITQSQLGHLERLQPFTETPPTSHIAWALHELNNIDKHRQIPFCQCFVGQVEVVKNEHAQGWNIQMGSGLGLPELFEGKELIIIRDLTGPFIESEATVKLKTTLRFGTGSGAAANQEVMPFMVMLANFLGHYVFRSPGCLDGFPAK